VNTTLNVLSLIVAGFALLVAALDYRRQSQIGRRQTAGVGGGAAVDRVPSWRRGLVSGARKPRERYAKAWSPTYPSPRVRPHAT
jgi:hypothetical protein